jgi:hypothetical protein
LQGQAKNLLLNAVELAYFMRGSVQYEQILESTPMEREIMADFINKRLKIESKKPNPIY